MKYSVKIWLFQSQLQGDAMAIGYAVDLTDAERAEVREIISNKFIPIKPSIARA
jgi:hypothetical protein